VENTVNSRFFDAVSEGKLSVRASDVTVSISFRRPPTDRRRPIPLPLRDVHHEIRYAFRGDF